jgi:hypothetical protein
MALSVIQDMAHLNSSSLKCYEVIYGLSRQSLEEHPEDANKGTESNFATAEALQTQINNMYPVMWPDIQPVEADFALQDGFWKEFLFQNPLDGNNDSSNNPEVGFDWSI